LVGTTLGQPSIQRQSDWSAGAARVAGRGSCQDSVSGDTDNIMPELPREMRQERAFSGSAWYLPQAQSVVRYGGLRGYVGSGNDRRRQAQPAARSW